MDWEPTLHVWVHTDDDLADLTITATGQNTSTTNSALATGTPTTSDTTKPLGWSVTSSSEVIHTNKEHPFLTTEKGFLPVGQITLGMHVVRADGTIGVVTGWKVVLGNSVMYNLEVAHDHTFTVGDGLWVVHNDCGPTFSNQYPEKLPTELSQAKQLGVKPIKVGDPGFQGMIQNGTVKWAVTQDQQLAFIPKFVGGTEIPHTVITAGADVLAAGEADIINTGNGYLANAFNNWSGHYLPDEASTVIGRQAFINAGIRFPPPILGLSW